MEQFTNQYSLSKTLRFELKPYGETLYRLKQTDILQKDEYKSKIRRDMQTIIDNKYKEIIEENLKEFTLGHEAIDEALSKEKNIKDKAIIALKKQIVENFKAKKLSFKAGDFIEKLTTEYPNNQIIQTFDKFSTYFTNFFDIRKHVFEGDTPGSIAYRLINENLKIYLNNIEKIKKLPEELKAKMEELNQISEPYGYNSFLTQTNINKYNVLLGGFTTETEKIQGFNELINLYCQKNHIKLPKLDQLYKMILSDQISSSFRFDFIDNDEELIEMINEYLEKNELQNNIEFLHVDKIFIDFKQLGNLPHVPYTLISSKIVSKYDEKNGGGKRKKTYENDRKKFIEAAYYSIEYLSDLLDDIDVLNNLKNRYQELIVNYSKAKDMFLSIDWSEIENIKQSEKKISIKNLLDSLKDIQRFYSLFAKVDEYLNPDIDFYNWLSKNESQIGYEFNAIYNKTRNYLTKKQYSELKFKLNFDSPTLGNGWDVNKEIDNSAFLMRKFNKDREDYDYYLGIWNKSTPRKEKVTKFDDQGDIEKMQYKLYPDPSKMLPKQFVKSKEWNSKYPISDSFIEKYDKGYHKKGESFDLAFLHEVIDRYKHGLLNHEDKYQETFGFNFRTTQDYQAYTEFLADVEKYNYKLSFERIADIAELVKSGKLYVFQIWSKDFSKYSKGTKNLSTIYFESLFSEENLKELIFKLSGNAEIFYRPASLKYDEDILKNGHHYENLKDKFNYPIIKDRRYSQDKFFFHVPITINNNSLKLGPKDFNDRINRDIDKYKHIIGIDRGERHLIYLSVVEIATGKIIEQKNLDEIVNIDTKGNEHKSSYLKKLEEKAGDRDDKRKSWDTINTIKELKEGYISQAVNEIRNLQEKYNALIVMENLNYGFKNSRVKVEKQVYQKFEIALIKKFNYLIDKKDPKTYLYGIQLTNPIATLDKIGNQSGVVMYIPAWNTSKIDPITGFVNHFYSDDLRYKNQEQTKSFIEKIDRIYFEDGVFKFDVDFAKWNDRSLNTRSIWTLTSYGKRINTFRNPEKVNQWCSEEIDLSERFNFILNVDGSFKNYDTETLKDFMHLFKLMVSLRNSESGTEVDYMISPVADKNGHHFDSRKGIIGLPKDADANGAYNIARKGLMVVDNIKNGVKNPFKISNEDYLKFIQSRYER